MTVSGVCLSSQKHVLKDTALEAKIYQIGTSSPNLVKVLMGQYCG